MGKREQIAIDTTLELFVFRLIGIIEAAEKELLRHETVVLGHSVIDAHGIGDERQYRVILYLLGQIARLIEQKKR